jgi:hypothetical protein
VEEMRHFESSEGTLLFPCRSVTVSSEIDFEAFLITTWRIVCSGKCRCHPPRVKSLKDTESSAVIREFTTPTFSARWGTLGVVMARRPEEGRRCAAGLAASQSLAVSMAETSRVFSIFQTGVCH